MSAWEAIQTRPVKEIVAEVFERMEGRSDSDPLSPWADLALALCERVTRVESRCAALERERDGAGARARALAADVLAAEAQRDEERAARGRLVVLLKTAELDRDAARGALRQIRDLRASADEGRTIIDVIEAVRRIAVRAIAAPRASDTDPTP